MLIGAVIPLKILSNSKSRLRKEFSTQEFNEQIDMLSEKLFYTVLSAVFFSQKVSEIVVATSDPKITEILSHLNIKSYFDRWTDLNLIVKDGISILRSSGCEIVLIFMADLPYISKSSIDQLLEKAILTDYTTGLIVIRSRDGGTTGLVQKPLGITPLFLNYVDSAEKHLNYATTYNIPSVMVDTEEFSFDIDTVADLSEFVMQIDDDLAKLIHQLRNLLKKAT